VQLAAVIMKMIMLDGSPLVVALLVDMRNAYRS
jgi:hypothetical protein